MITTVTTTTAATALTPGLAGSLAAIAVVTLLVLLIHREILVSSSDARGKAIGQTMDVLIVPLVLGFLLVTVEAVLQVLR